MHGLAGQVPVDPALHRGPEDLEAGGDLADRVTVIDDETGDQYWVSSVKRGRLDRYPAGTGEVTVDDDARSEYDRIIAKGS